ncbi:arylesterase [Caldovatus aquaticus]|nr:arylesterase [Caldovatus aquaticus]
MSTGYGRRAALRHLGAGCGLLLARAGAARTLGTAAGDGEEVRLLMLGDSLTAGYGLPAAQSLPARLEAALRARGRAVRVVNAGVSGDTAAGGRARLDWALAALPEDAPAAAIVALGANDGLRGLPAGELHANLAAILDGLGRRGVPALLAGMYAPPNLGPDYGREFAEAYRRLARERSEVVFYPFLLEGVAGDPALNQPDGIHPNPRGVEEIVRRMLPAVETLLDRAGRGRGR